MSQNPNSQVEPVAANNNSSTTGPHTAFAVQITPSKTTATNATVSTTSTNAATTTASTTPTSFGNIEQLQQQAPELYRAITQGIANMILNGMTDHQQRLKQLYRDLKNNR